MGLYDIIDEMTKRESVKTELGDSRIWGVVVGIVTKNRDPNSTTGGGGSSGDQAMDGRVCVTIPTWDDKANELKWARVVMPSSGSGWGHYFLPEVGDQVLLAFEEGHIEKPYIIGCVPKATDRFLKESVDKDNQFKRIVTKHGTAIVFEDNSQDENGLKDKLTMETAGKKLQICLDNGAETIRIGDKAGEDWLTLYTKEGAGTLTMKLKSKLTLQVGDKIKLTMNGESGAVSLEADSIALTGADRVKLDSDSAVKLAAAQISAQASSSLNLESEGSTKVAGNSVSIG